MLTEAINRAERAVEVMLSRANRGASAPAGFRQDLRAARQADHTRETSTLVKEDCLMSYPQAKILPC